MEQSLPGAVRWTGAPTLLVLSALGLAGCGVLAALEGGSAVTVTGVDGADAAVADHAVRDTAGADALPADVAPTDTAALADAALPDLASSDAALPDAALPDLASPDAALPDAAPANWHLPGFSCRVRVDIRNDHLSAPLDDFTLQVPLRPAELPCAVVFHPGNISFVNADGAPLDHELEAAPPGAPTPAWVRLPLIAPAPAPAFFWLYFGTTQSMTGTATAPTWGPAFRGVWHLDEDLDSESAARDSTSHAHDATPEGFFGSYEHAAGLVGYAQGFDGQNDHLLIGDPADGALDFDGESSFTYSLSVYTASSAGTDDMPWYKGGSSRGNPGYDLELGAGCWGVGLSDGVDEDYRLLCFGTDGEHPSRWTNIAVVVDRAAPALHAYVNGTAAFMAALPQSYDVSNGEHAAIGAESYGNFPFRGLIDEVRVVAAARSAEWIATEERSLRATLLALGAVESGG